MTLGELADYLKVAKAELEEMAEKGGIPGTKVQSHWRFMRSVVDDWLIDYMKRLDREDLRRLIATEGGPLSLRSLIRPELVSTALRAGTKTEILKQLAHLPVRDGCLDPSEEPRLLELLVDREEMVSTAIFPGVAIPHPRNPGESPIRRPAVAVGICPEGTEFDSLDMEPTYVLFLVCAGHDILHLKLIAEIALLVRSRDLVESLRRAPDAAAVTTGLFPA